MQQASFPSRLVIRMLRTVDFRERKLCLSDVSLLSHLPAPVLGNSFSLSAVVTHFGYYESDKHGSAGHFVCFIRSGSLWYLINDDELTLTDESTVLCSPWWLALYEKGICAFSPLLSWI